MTAILGLNAYHGDAAAALVVDGKLVAAAEEERFSRVKHVAGFPSLAAAWCLTDAGLSPDDLDHVAIGRNPRANAAAKLRQTSRHPPRLGYIASRLRNAGSIHGAQSALEAALGGPVRAEIHNVEHHQAHVASAFFVSPFDEAAVLSVDGFGDFASTMFAHGHDDHVHILERVLFPHSLGIAYTAVTQWLGFPHYGDEGKVMGLAPYGDSERFLPAMREIVRTNGDLFRLDLQYFTHHREGVAMTWDEGSPTIGRIFSPQMEELLGPKRAPGSELTDVHNDVAAALQARLEEVYLHLVQALARLTGSKNLALAGGVALNAVVNGRIRPETPFDGVYVQPAAGDSGTAVGAAFHVWHGLGNSRSFVMEHAYTGPAYSDEECAVALHDAGIIGDLMPDDALFAFVAERIAAGDVVGWFQGRMEFGPRALGNRSIVTDPRRHDMKDILNARIKHREPFRPFAPSVLAHRAGEWFDQDYTSPFMVMVYNVLTEKRDLVPAITHVDGTGRLQTVEKHVNPRYFRLISEFDRLTGVPMLLNTSFNENEPVVMSPQHAVETFMKTHMDLLVLGNYVVRRAASSYTADSASVAAAHE